MSKNEPWLPSKHVLSYNDYELELAFRDIPARGYSEQEEVLRYYDKRAVFITDIIIRRMMS